MTLPDQVADKVTIFKGNDGQHYWHWQDAGNSKVLFQGEGYEHVQDILDLLITITRNGMKATVVYGEGVHVPDGTVPGATTPPNTDISGEPR